MAFCGPEESQECPTLALAVANRKRKAWFRRGIFARQSRGDLLDALRRALFYRNLTRNLGTPLMPKKQCRKRANRRKLTPTNQDSSVVYRVWKIDARLKEAITESRQAQELTLRDFVSEAVASELPDLVLRLSELGVAVEDITSIAPVRYPMTESTLKALRYASQASGLDQSQLVVACLRLATRRKRRRSGPSPSS